MKEAQDMFHDDEFINNPDTNEYLMGCSNGIIDLKADNIKNIFRKGKHDDYV